MIELKLGQYTGKANSINKTFLPSLTINLLRFNTDSVETTVRLGNTDLNLNIYGYACITKDDENIYYFVDNIEWLGKRGVILNLRKDVLFTYRENIKSSVLIVEDSNRNIVESLEHTNDNYIIIVGG